MQMDRVAIGYSNYFCSSWHQDTQRHMFSVIVLVMTTFSKGINLKFSNVLLYLDVTLLKPPNTHDYKIKKFRAYMEIKIYKSLVINI